MRPKTPKNICCCPCSHLFKSSDESKEGGVFVELTLEEVEALDLKNIKNLDQIAAARAMQTSQSTFQRILSSAYKKISDALVNGKTIKIEE